MASFDALRREQADIEVHERADSGNLISLVRVDLAEEWPEKLAALGEKVTKAHVARDVTRIRLLVIVQAVQIGSHRISIVQVHTSVAHNIILSEIDNVQSLEVFELEESEQELFDSFFFIKDELSIARIVHVDRRNSRRYHLYKIQIINCSTHWSHDLNMMDVSPKTQYESILVLLENCEDRVSVGIVPKHLELVVPIVAKKDVRLSDEMSVWVGFENLLNPVDLGYGHLLVGKVFIKGVHPVQRNHHCVVT